MAGGGLSASQPSTVYSCISSRTQNSPCPKPPSWGIPPRLLSENHRRLCSSDLQVNPTRFAGMSQNISFRCSSSTRPGGPPGPGESDSRSVLDAFFLGKALAEALNERIESTVGEFLSAIGRLQAEQQKQVQDFQEEVLERAKRAKEKAAREAMEAQGLISKSSTETVSAAVDDDATTNLPSVSPPNSSPAPSLISSTADADPDPTESEPRAEVPNED